MKKLSLTIPAVLMIAGATLLAASPVHAENFGIGINIGNLGFGVEARQPLSPSFDLRFGIAGIAYKTDFEYDDVDYDITQTTAVPEVKLDWRPMQGTFRLTLGLAFYNQVSELELTPTSGTYDIGNTNYTAAQVGTLNGKVSHHVGAPYFGVGWDFLPQGKNLGFTIDVGAYYRNEPEVSLTSTGTVTANDLAIEAQNIKDDTLTFVPTVKLGMLFRF
jgi:hypothetical protein